MKILALVITVIIYYFTRLACSERCYAWIRCYLHYVKKYLSKTPLWRGWVAYLVCLIPPAIVVCLLTCLLHGRLLGLLGFVFSIVVLLYCLGPKNLFKQLAEYRQAVQAKDDAKEREIASEMLHEPLPANEAQLDLYLAETTFLILGKNILSVIFWFLLFGPVGAVIYRFTLEFTKLSKEEEFSEIHHASAWWLEVLAWIPVRLAGLTYALMGDFVSGFGYWIKNAWSDIGSNDSFIKENGKAALNNQQAEEDNAEILQDSYELAERTLMTWVVLIFLISLVAWLF